MPAVIEYPEAAAQSHRMTRILAAALFAALMHLAPPAWAADCYADYKAKQDNPLRLHYGVMKLNGACATGPARGEIEGRLSRDGWTLLNVISVFGSDGLTKRRENAGSYFLRY